MWVGPLADSPVYVATVLGDDEEVQAHGAISQETLSVLADMGGELRRPVDSQKFFTNVEGNHGRPRCAHDCPSVTIYVQPEFARRLCGSPIFAPLFTTIPSSLVHNSSTSLIGLC